MIHCRWTRWKRDLATGAAASFLTAAVLVAVVQGSIQNERRRAEAAARRALDDARLARDEARQARQQAEAARAQSGRELVDAAADALVGFRGGDRADTSIMQVPTAAVAPEVPQGAHLLVDRKATAFAAGDIAVYRVEDKNYVGRVVSFDPQAGRLTVGRNSEPNREISLEDVVGRVVLNSR